LIAIRLAFGSSAGSPAASVDPSLVVAQEQLALQREVAQADIQIKRDKAHADMPSLRSRRGSRPRSSA